MRLVEKGCAAFVLFASVLTPAADQVPRGWIEAGSKPQQYEVGVDRTERRGNHPVAFVKGIEGQVDTTGFGTLMQMTGPGNFLGKRVRFSADVKSEKVDSGWAGLWFRVDGPERMQSLSFDNMQDRPIKGTEDWKHVEIVLDVPENATAIAFGILLAGPGQVWMGNLDFQIVPDNVPTTGRGTPPQRSDKPQNLDFDD